MRNEKKNRLLIESVRYITGNQSKIKVHGPTRFVEAYGEVIRASKKLYEALHSDNVQMKTVEKLVERKNQAAAKFKSVTGSVWPF